MTHENVAKHTDWHPDGKVCNETKKKKKKKKKIPGCQSKQHVQLTIKKNKGGKGKK